ATDPTAQLQRQKTELTPDQKEFERIRQAKLKRFESALSAPAIINSAGIGGSGLIPSAYAAATATAAAAGNPLAELGNLKRDLLDQTPGDPNKQERKEDFYLQKQPATEYLPHTRNQQQSPLEVKTGTVIPATMLGGLNSDLPGMILAQVSQNVYDTATGGYLLIPQGSRLVGIYDNYIAYGQNRALVVWNRIVYPDGSTLELEGMPGTDQGGYAGLEDQVDNHYFRIFGSAILMSVITGMYDFSQDSGGHGDEQSAGDTLASAVAREMAQTSQMMLRKNLNIQPTIKIRPGYKLNVMVKRDIIFPAVW
ncbi:MAG: conjugal transfer protein TrbI, partial [Desulfobulbaceae bacterium]|nr:conjugal transfer protein TrbI [Desulfobulbaceae bacterium]